MEKKVSRAEIVEAFRKTIIECGVKSNIFAEALVTLIIKDALNMLFKED